jgi:hypothetical protein
MRSFLKTLGNAALVVAGFFTVFFGVSRVTTYSSDASLARNLNTDIAYADAPTCGDSGCAGSGDSGGDSGGGDSGDSGGSGK